MFNEIHLENNLKLSEEAITLLAEDCLRYAVLQADLPARVLRYLIDGTDEEILTEISTLVQSGLNANTAQSSTNYIPIYDSYIKAAKARSKFFKIIAIQDAEFYYRLAQLYSKETLNFKQSQVIPLGSFATLDTFLNELIGDDYDPLLKKLSEFPVSIVEEILKLAGEDTASLAHIVYLGDIDNWHGRKIAKICGALKGFADYSVKYKHIVVASLNHSNHNQRLHALEILIQCGIQIAHFIEEIVERATCASKMEREAAEALLKQDVAVRRRRLGSPAQGTRTKTEVVIPYLEEKAEKGKAEERLYAVKLLAELAGKRAKSFLQQRLAVEKSEKVRNTLERALVEPETSSVITPDILLPPLAEVQLDVPIDQSVISNIEAFVDEVNRGIRKTVDELSKYGLYSSRDLEWKLNLFLNLFHTDVFQKARKIIEATDQPVEERHKEFILFIKNSKQKEIKTEHIVSLLQKGSIEECCVTSVIPYSDDTASFNSVVFRLLENSSLALIHAVRLLMLIGAISSNNMGNLIINYRCEYFLRHYRNNHEPTFGLRELAAIFRALGLNPEAITSELIPDTQYYYYRRSPFLNWPDEAIWPYFADKLDFLENLLNPQFSSQCYGSDKTLRGKIILPIIEKFPQAPEQFLPKLWDIALGTSKTESLLAQRCLDKHSNTKARVVLALQDKEASIRSTAATWLGRLNDSDIIPKLKESFKTEKSDLVKDALVRSLEKLGASVDEFLDLAGLLKEAQTGLKKGIPEALSWFPFNRLPVLHWQDTNKSIEPEIITWFIVSNYKQKTPEPSLMLRRYVEYFQPKDKEALGQFILENWLAQDTLPKYSLKEAEDLARQDANKLWLHNQNYLQQEPKTLEEMYQKQYDSHIQYYKERNQTPTADELKKVEEQCRNSAQWMWEYCQELEAKTEEKLYREELNRRLAEFKGSAIKEKGILAVSAVCCSVAALPLINNYLKTYYGYRMVQCNALLQVVNWIEDFSAIQLLLSVANRFRTKGIQLEAERLVNQLAERKGWTKDELSDRTIPYCGFSDKEKMVLDYDSRQFTARLDKDFNFILTDSLGKVIKFLPEARKDEDVEQVKATKKQFLEAKKQLKQVLILQQERLYEAMCTQRAWKFEDWNTFLNQHPIMGKYCQRLVWLVIEQEQVIKTFRPLEDGTLTDENDEEVTLESEAMVSIAHASLLAPEKIKAWRSHLSDYEIVPLFEQFGTVYELSEELKQQTEIKDFEGHLIESFQLRSQATKLGYVRGQSEDAGWFYDYKKSFSSLEIEAVINFTGNFLPEENRLVALTNLYFKRRAEQNQPYLYQNQQIPLSELPAVLLSQVWSELRTIAAQGSGYDPDWQKKT